MHQGANTTQARDGRTGSRAASRLAGPLLGAVLAGMAPAASAQAGPAGVSQSPAVLTVVSDDNYPPYIFRDADGNLEGYLVDLWQIWQARTGVQVKLVATDWAMAQRMMAERRADVIETVFRTPARERWLDFSPPYTDIPVSIFAHADIGGIANVATLKGFLVGAKDGDACIEKLVDRGIGTFDLYPSYSRLIQGAAAGRVKVFCLDEPPANFLLYRAGLHRDFRKAFTLYTGQFHRAVHKDNAPALAMLREGFAAITPAEERRLRDKWMGSELDLLPYGRYLGYGLTAALLLGLGLATWSVLLRRQVRLRTDQLERERSRLDALAENSADWVWTLDTRGRHTYANNRCEELLGYPREEFLHRDPLELVHPDDHPLMAATFRQAMEERRGWQGVVLRWRHRNGEYRELESNASPLFDAEGRLTGFQGADRDITEKSRMEDALREQKEFFRLITENIDDLVAVLDLDGRRIYNSPSYGRLFGDADALRGTDSFAEIHPDDREHIRDIFRETVRTGVGQRASFRFQLPDGEIRHMESQGAVIRNAQDQPWRVVVVSRDITERVKAEEKLRLSAQVVASTAEGIIVTGPDGNIQSVNPAFTDITGYTEEEALGRNPRFLGSGRHDRSFYQGLWNSLVSTGHWRGELWNRRKNGEVYPELLTISSVRNGSGNTLHYVGIFSDITTLRQSQDALNFLAHHDPLTGLPNRTLFHDRLEHALRRVSRDQGRLAVLFVDLDRFKNVNDSLGHSVGDELLRQVAGRMAEQMRGSDTLARVGGDEFVILLEDDASSRNAGAVAAKLVEMFDSPVQVGGHTLYVTCSIGISLYPHDGMDADTLLRQADLAMYQAKEHGRNTFQFYETGMGANAFQRMVVENALRGAVSRNELLLHYQPQVSLDDGSLGGVEALVRWRHPDMGLVPPTQFIPVAEEIGLIGEIGDWVLREACRQMAAWRDAGLDIPRMAVNLSVRQLEQDRLVPLVARLLEEWGLPPSRLELEVTESAIMRQTGRAVERLEGLRRLGVYLAIDDFGTGQSSLGQLRQLPVHRLKIDHSFVRDIGADANAEAIVRAIIALGRSLGLEIVAEGVERQDQGDFLRREGSHCAQGYLYSRPVSAEEIMTAWGNAGPG